MAAGDALKEEVLQSLEDLPEERLREVHDFILFLRSREHADEDPLLEVAGILDTDPVSSREIDDILYGEEAS